MRQRFVQFASVAILQLAALVLAHQLVYLARYGSRFGEALQHAGHGDAWTVAVASSGVLGVALAVAASARLAYLRIQVRRNRAVQPTPGGNLDHWILARSFLRIAPRLVALTSVLLTVQENLEHAASGLAMPGPAILLTEEYQGGLWITIAVALAASLVAALFDWRRRVLEARLRAARRSAPRLAVAASPRPAIDVARPANSLLGRNSALRAPPTVASTA